MSAAPPVEVEPRVARRARDGGRVGAVCVALAAVAFAALVGLSLVGRYWSAPPGVLVALVMLLPYLFAAFGAVIFALWAVVPDRSLPPFLLAGAVLWALGLWGPSFAKRAEEAEGDELVAMTWNVRRLWGGPDDGGDPRACVVRVIEQEAPDVVALLEVSAADVDALSGELGLRCAHGTYRGTTDRRHGGLAVCVRGDRWRLVSGRAQRFVDAEDWYYVFSEVERGGRVANLLAVHLYPYAFSASKLRRALGGEAAEIADLEARGERVHEAQGTQSAALLSRVERLRDPTVVAGDFNSTRDAALHYALRSNLADAWERGGRGLGGTVRVLERVPLRVDYVYATDAFAVRAARVPDAGCSDHRPVVSELVLRAE